MIRTAAAIVFLFFISTAVVASTLSGVVTRSDNGAPVDSAMVLVRGTTLHVRTNSQGVYSIPSIPSGAYGITCSAVGLMGQSTGAVDLSQDNTHDFALAPGAADTVSVTGTTTCNGSPCSGILVQALDGGRVLSVALSGPSGAFSISGLAAGTYDFRSMAIGYHVGTSSQVVVDTTSPPSVSLALSSAGPFTLTGHVRLDDNPLDRSGSNVRVFGTSPSAITTTIASGEYELSEVPAGPISIAASHNEYRWHHRLDLLVQGDTVVDFILRKDDGQNSTSTFNITGTVRLQDTPDTDPLNGSGSTVSIWQEDKSPRLATVGTDGTYRFNGIHAGTWQMGAAMEGYTSVNTEPFELTSNKTQDFILEKDTSYQWGPGAADGELGCQCSSMKTSNELALIFVLLVLFCRRRH